MADKTVVGQSPETMESLRNITITPIMIVSDFLIASSTIGTLRVCTGNASCQSRSRDGGYILTFPRQEGLDDWAAELPRSILSEI